MYGELIYRYQRWRGLFADRHGIAGVILVLIRHRHILHPFAHIPHRLTRILEGRITGEEGVDQDARFARIDAEAGMAEPGDVHGLSSEKQQGLGL
jgi:hypothetical protein